MFREYQTEASGSAGPQAAAYLAYSLGCNIALPLGDIIINITLTEPKWTHAFAVRKLYISRRV